MTITTHQAVICAVVDLVKAACPFAEVQHNGVKPRSPAPGGTVIVRDGDAGEPEVDLSPPVYNYQRKMPLEIFARDLETVMALQGAIGDAVEADRGLGGLCDYLDAEAGDLDQLDAAGAATMPAIEAALIPHYATSNPLK